MESQASGYNTPLLFNAATSAALMPSRVSSASAACCPRSGEGLDSCRLAVDAHRAGGHLERPVRVVLDLRDTALLEGGIVLKLHRVEDRTGRHADSADSRHSLFLGLFLRPLGAETMAAAERDDERTRALALP
jgi:hypothetical protein